MLKYLNSAIVFQEVPDEVALAVNLTGCPCRCPGCHSKFLWSDEGEPLTEDVLDNLIDRCHENITCVALMGGDSRPGDVDRMMEHVKKRYSGLRTAWYSGRSLLSPAMNLNNLDYVKLGPYLAHLGALKSRHTNQRLYKVIGGKMQDITSRFWAKA